MDYSNLNLQQREAVKQTDGPLMILAGAGSGKTKTLVTKISHLINKKNISPFEVLALTFSNKAAKEMRYRVSREVSEDIGALQITTFHAFCAKLLRSEANYLGLSKSFTIYDTTESKSVVKAILGKYGIGPKELSPFEVLYYIDELKNFGHYLGGENHYKDDEVEIDHEFYPYFQEYEHELRRNNAIDFGGLITAVINLFEKFPDVLERYQNRFSYILIDEYQDTNRAQFRLIEMLSQKKKNICVVGDEDQSIYSWRGADIRNILEFEATFPEAKILKLEQNYRSSKNIIEAASFVIDRNTMRKGKKMWTENPQGEEITIVECKNEKIEAEFIGDNIQEHRHRENIPLNEFAVFYRTNAQSRVIEDCLRNKNIPYRIVGGIKFYERKEIKDLLAYLRIIVNEKDSLALTRIINLPARGIGTVTIRKLETEAIQRNISLYELLKEIDENIEEFKGMRLSSKVKSALRQFVSLIEEAKNLNTNESVPSLVYDKILQESGYWEMLKSSKDYESMARMENLEELSSAIMQFEETTKNPSMGGFLETITLDAHNDNDEENEGEVSLMTVHGAKGLEFSHVYVTGVEENIFPSFKSLEDGAMAEEEERRLFYVAMTRAMKKLYLTFAQGRMLFGQLRFNGPSRFIHEIPNKFYQWNKCAVEEEYMDSEEAAFLDEFADEQYEDDEKVEYQVKLPKKEKIPQKFPKGCKVMHKLYGEGKVLSSSGIGPEEKVEIKFRDGAKKKFLVRFAPLSPL